MDLGAIRKSGPDVQPCPSQVITWAWVSIQVAYSSLPLVAEVNGVPPLSQTKCSSYVKGAHRMKLQKWFLKPMSFPTEM